MKYQTLLQSITAALLAASPLMAQPTDPPAPPPGNGAEESDRPGRMKHHGPPDWEKLGDKLGLSEGQLEDLKAHSASQRAKMEAIREDSSLQPKEKMQKAREVFRAGRPEVEKILTPEQLEKLKELIPHRGERGERRAGEGRGKKGDAPTQGDQVQE